MPSVRRVEAPFSPDFIAQIVRVFRDARRGPLQFLIDLHDPEEDARFLKDRLLPENQIWIAESDSLPVGFIAFHDGWVKWLVIDPTFQGRGIGTRLLDVAKESAQSLQLWVFETNRPAIEFYRRRGFSVAERTDGADNEAHLPDLRMVWRRQP